MRIKTLLVAFLVIFLSGCATARKGHDDIEIQQLQNRKVSLEAELQQKDERITNLENELDKFRYVPLSSSREKTDEKDSNPLRLPIKQIQTALKNAGFHDGSVDGKMGSQTKASIKNFQKFNGLKADGVLGEKTWSKLRKYSK